MTQQPGTLKDTALRWLYAIAQSSTLLGLAMIGLIWMSLAFHVEIERDSAEHAAIENSRNLARAFEAHLSQSLNDINRTLDFVRSYYQRDPRNVDLSVWNANARLLYDLQKVCYDDEHEIYKVDLLRWALSLGKTPLKRPLPNQRVVLMSKHLRGATLRVPNVDIDPHGRRELSHLLHEAAAAAENSVNA